MIARRGRAWLAACLMLACFGVAARDARCSKKRAKVLMTASGSPIRKIAIRSASPDMTRSAAAQIAGNTCLTVVSDPKRADAVLQVGIALPDLNAGGGAATADVFGPSAEPQTMGEKNSRPHQSISASCSDNGSGCTRSYKGFHGSGAEQPASEWQENGGTRLDVSLTQPGNASNELWEPDLHKKKSWSTQLRRATGCPVCPGEHFNPKKYPTYRGWIQARCPAMLATP